MKPLLLKPHPLLSSGTRTYASEHQPTQLHRTCVTSHHESMSLLQSLGAFHPKVSFSSPTPSGEYPPYRTGDLHITFDDSTNTHPSSFRYSIPPCGLRLLTEFHLAKPFSTSRPTLQAASSGAHDRNHTRKTTWALAYQRIELPLSLCRLAASTVKQSPFWY